MMLVSAIYKNGPTSIIGGRGRDIHFYISSLRNIANLNLPFVLYCDPVDVEEYTNILARYFKEFWVFGFSLKDYQFYKEIITEKEKLNSLSSINDRNEILCHNKMFFLEKTILKQLPNATDIYLWIDSGLTHHGIVPEKVGGVELLTFPDASKYYPANIKNIFNPTLSEKYKTHIPTDKLYFCAHYINYQMNDNLKEYTKQLFSLKEISCGYHLIGGIFGGRSNLILDIIPAYTSLLKYINIDHKYITLEEELFSLLYAAMPEKFNLDIFTTWWFFSPGERTGYLNEDGDSFYKIFKRIHDQ